MTKNIEVTESGLVCDNPQCDWVDRTVTHEQLKDWVNAPCPKCGDNVLTEQDYNDAVVMMESLELINSLNPEQIEALASSIPPEKLQEYLKGIPGAEHMTDPTKEVVVHVHAHKGINILGIEPANMTSKEGISKLQAAILSGQSHDDLLKEKSESGKSVEQLQNDYDKTYFEPKKPL